MDHASSDYGGSGPSVELHSDEGAIAAFRGKRRLHLPRYPRIDYGDVPVRSGFKMAFILQAQNFSGARAHALNQLAAIKYFALNQLGQSQGQRGLKADDA